MSGKQSPSMNHLLSTTLRRPRHGDKPKVDGLRGGTPCPDWIVTCGGGLEMGVREEAPLPPHPPSQRAVTSPGVKMFIHLRFLLPLSLSPSLPFSLHKRLPATYWGSSPLLVWKAKDQQEALDSSSWVKFIYEKPAQVPPLETLTFQGCTGNSWHQNTAWDLERRSWRFSRLQGPGWEEALAWREGVQPQSGVSRASGAGQRGQPMSVGTAVLVRVDAGKGYAPLLHGNSDHQGSETQADSYPLVRKSPHPSASLGFSQIAGDNKGPRHSNHNARISVLTSHALNGPLRSYSDSWDFLRPQKPASYRGESVENKILLWAGQECLIRYEFLGKFCITFISPSHPPWIKNYLHLSAMKNESLYYNTL